MSGLTDIDYRRLHAGRGTHAAASVIRLEDLFGVFGIKRGDWRALALRLAYGRWANAAATHGRQGHRSNRAILPKAIGTNPLADPAAIERECRDFRVAAPEEASGVHRAVPDRAVPDAGRT